MKLLFYDLETTGLDHQRHAIHQLSGKIVVGGIVKETFNIKMQPHDGAEISKEALNVSGVTEEAIRSYDSISIAFTNFKTILNKYVNRYDSSSKFHLTGYNNSNFDNNFLRSWFLHNNDRYYGSYFWSDSIDVMCLASHYLKSVRGAMPNFKLCTVAERVGIAVDSEKLHDALYDIELTEQIYNRITSPSDRFPDTIGVL